MRRAGNLFREEMVAARADAGVEIIAQALFAERDEPHVRQELLELVMASVAPFDPALTAPAVERFAGVGRVLGVISDIQATADRWRSELDSREIAKRKGAILERLVELLLTIRLSKGRVFREERVQFSDGGPATDPIDVLGTPLAARWEAIECKSSGYLDGDAVAHLDWTLRRSAENANELMVVVATATAQASLVPKLRAVGRYLDLFFLSAESLFTLGSVTPQETVPAP